VQKESAQELGGAKGHCAGLATVGVILPAESHALLLEGQQAMIRNGHAICTLREIVAIVDRPQQIENEEAMRFFGEEGDADLSQG